MIGPLQTMKVRGYTNFTVPSGAAPSFAATLTVVARSTTARLTAISSGRLQDSPGWFRFGCAATAPKEASCRTR